MSFSSLTAHSCILSMHNSRGQCTMKKKSSETGSAKNTGCAFFSLVLINKRGKVNPRHKRSVFIARQGRHTLAEVLRVAIKQLQGWPPVLSGCKSDSQGCRGHHKWISSSFIQEYKNAGGYSRGHGWEAAKHQGWKGVPAWAQNVCLPLCFR